MEYVDINTIINDNYDSIKNKIYNWKKEEVSAIYKLALSALKKHTYNLEYNLLIHFY